MSSLIYTTTKGKLTRKQREARAVVLKEQQAIKKELQVYKPLTSGAQPYRRTTEHIPSLGSGVGVAVKANDKVYTGDAMIGIGTLHKSNAVPIFKEEDAKDLARMRR
jgi:hypothetical protein